MKDATGDIMIYLAELCYIRGWDVDGIVLSTWERVSKRDWRTDPEKGGESSEG